MPQLSKKLQKQLFSLGFVLAVVLVSAVQRPARQPASTLQPTPPPSPSPTIPVVQGVATDSATLVPVASITDGDTIKVRIADATKTVRLVGINTPETKDPRKPVECFGQEASAALTQLLAGQSVRLETDPTQSDQDRYGRLLRFVFLPDGRDVGLWMLEQGYAQESLYSAVPHRYRAAYVAAEQRAKDAGLGLWNPEKCKI